ncbi:MAG: CoA-binding protein [Saprospiraceae bacterium]|nr:CoA-binding protein [Saprospiraceae bacterium]
MKKTLVLGATPNPSRFAYLATLRLRHYGHPVELVGIRQGDIAGIPISHDLQPLEAVHTVTLYLNPTRQKPYYDYILSLNPERIIFNPGTENPELEALAEAQGIESVEGCTLVMLSTGQY